MAFTGCFLAHVPKHERLLAESAMPGAAVVSAPWGPDQTHVAHDAKVLSVMIHDTVRAEELARLPRLQAVITRSDGFDHLPVDWMEEHGVAGYHLEGYATDSVAHLALMMLIALARRVPEGTATTRSGSWDRSGLVGRHLGELTVGIVGTGRIGGALARILDAMGVDSVGYDIDPDQRLDSLQHHRSAESLEGLLAKSDAITLHVPLDDGTRRMVDDRFLDRVRPGALLVNAARGDVVHAEAVLRALDAGRLAGFAADVLPDEPAVPDLSGLARRQDVLLTPHLGAHNRATIQARHETHARIAAAVLGGRPEDVAQYRVV